MKVSEYLLCSVEDIWKKYNQHPFVKGIEDGTLAKDKFCYYIVQDFLYLLDYTKVFAVGLAKAKNPKIIKLFSNYIDLLTNTEMIIHKDYMKEFNITMDYLYSQKPHIDNISYTSYMLKVAYEEGEVEALAAILSCAYSYEVIAKNIIKNNPDSVNHPFYGQWIKGYASEKYAQENVYLLDMLDEVSKDFTPKQIENIKDIFVNCSKYELMFWDMAWRKEE